VASSKRRFLLTAVQRNRNAQLRLRALQEIAASRDAEAFDSAIEMMGGWPRDERREGVKIMLQALAERRIGRRDQANAWIWRMAEYTREVHEEYAVQRWPETKRLLGLLVNSSGSAHARNARRLVHASRKEDRRLSAALLAAALAHTRRPRRPCVAPGLGWPANRRRWPESCCATSPRGGRGKNRRRRKVGATTAPGASATARSESTLDLSAGDDDVGEDDDPRDAPDDVDDADDTDDDDSRIDDDADDADDADDVAAQGRGGQR